MLLALLPNDSLFRCLCLLYATSGRLFELAFCLLGPSSLISEKWIFFLFCLFPLDKQAIPAKLEWNAQSGQHQHGNALVRDYFELHTDRLV